MTTLKAPFPWFGGKSKVAGMCWDRFGEVRNYVEPYAGSLAVLLGRPEPFGGTETVNDADGHISNFWRALQADPVAVAEYADWPVNENDLHARHAWLVERNESLRSKLEGDPGYYNAHIAGWWVWGICCWIGGGFCSGKGPWRVVEVDGTRHLVNTSSPGEGVCRKRPELRSGGEGIQAGSVSRRRPDMTPGGRGVNRGRVELRHNGRGIHQGMEDGGLLAWLKALADRLRRVRVCCGDWSRVCGPTPTVKQGLTAVFLDPPYGADAGRDPNLYTTESLTVATDCREWCLENGNNPLLRIALCGYEGEGHESLEEAGWSVVSWKASGGYASLGDSVVGKGNRERERIWFSPHCVSKNAEYSAPSLFD